MRFRSWVILASALLAAACSNTASPQSEEDELEAIPFPSTHVLTKADLDSLLPEKGDGKLSFEDAPPSLESVTPGEVIVAGLSSSTPHGLLRVVTKVDAGGSGLVLDTVQAPIQLAFRKLHVKAHRSTRPIGSATGAGAAMEDGGISAPSLGTQSLGGSESTSLSVDVVVFDGDGDSSTTNDQVIVHGALGGGFDYGFGFDVDWGSITDLPKAVKNCIASLVNVVVGKPPECSLAALLPEAKASFDVDPRVTADAKVTGAAVLDYKKDFDLLSINEPPLVLGPLVFFPVIDITARVEGVASSRFSAGVHGSVKFHSAVEVSSRDQGHPRYSPPKLESTDFHADTPEIVLHAGVKAGIGARLNLLLYSVTGPYLTARAYGAVDADPFSEPCYRVRAGMDGDIGVKVTSPDLPVLGHVTLADWSTTFTPVDIDVGSGSCTTPPNPPMLPPGSGPEATAFAKPAFEPWAKLYSYPVDNATGAVGPGGITDWIDETRAIDGRLILGGRSIRSLIKLDEEGTMTWARALHLSDDDRKVFSPYRTIATKDAGLMVLTSDGFQPILVKMTQDGRVQWSRMIDFGQSPCAFVPMGLVADGSTGYWIVLHGGCSNPEHTYVVHVDENADVLGTTELADPTDAVRPSLTAAIDGDVVVGGVLPSGSDRMFMIRLGEDGSVKYANQYIGCDGASDNAPVTSVVESNGDLTIAGRGGAGHNAHVARIKPDGSVGFAAFPGFGFGAGSIFVIDSLVELPTTGYIASGSTDRLTGESPTNVPSMALAGLDSAGRVLWAKRYTLGDGAGGWISASQSSLRLTDDGGVMVTVAAAGTNGLDGRLLSMKAFAKDGSLQFANGRGLVTVLDGAGDLKNLDCSLRASPWPANISTPAAPRTVDTPMIAVPSSYPGELESAP